MTHRERLEALRDRLESEIEQASEQMLPQLVGQYRATLKDLAELEAQTPTAGMQDDLKAKRAERRERQKRGTPRRTAEQKA